MRHSYEGGILTRVPGGSTKPRSAARSLENLIPAQIEAWSFSAVQKQREIGTDNGNNGLFSTTPYLGSVTPLRQIPAHSPSGASTDRDLGSIAMDHRTLLRHAGYPPWEEQSAFK